MNGIQQGKVREILVSAFDLDGLDMLLSDRFDFNRAREVGGDGRAFKKVVADVLQRFSDEGLDAVLIAEVAARRPNRPDVQDLYQKYARALVADSWTQRVDAARLKALETYGALPTSTLLQRGRPVGEAYRSLSQDGFQRTIRGFVPQFDVEDWATNLLKVTKRVCRIDVDQTPLGTGFLVGSDCVLTNHHVLQSAISHSLVGSRIRCVFGYWMVDGKPAEGLAVSARGSMNEWHLDSSAPLKAKEEHEGRPLATHDNLDYVLFRLDRRIGDESIFPGGPNRGWIRVPETAPPLAVNMPMAILQHPEGQPLKLALDTQAVLSVNENRTRLRYAVNTEAGSSGSPCFGLDFTLVALHQFGDPGQHPPTYNQGIPIAAVRERLTAQGKAALLGGTPP
jgi:Trypsin-like peptidase domain/Effector-associated domain 1